MIRISQLKLPVDHGEEALYKAIKKQARGKEPLDYKIIKQSIDARKKPNLFYIYTIDAVFEHEKPILEAKNSKWTKPVKKNYVFPYMNNINIKDKNINDKKDQDKMDNRPVIIGAGPAGLFAGLVLAKAGYAPIIIERGESVEKRTLTVESFFEGALLNEESNVQFGEGGAGTFSDGKLNTLVKDKFGRNRYVLEEFVAHGAPEEILYEAKPHIGTDILKNVVASIRNHIISLGGEVHFETKMTEILLSEETPKHLTGIRIIQGGITREIKCRSLILAIGHSARDTFSMLYEKNAVMHAKAFAMGVRVEHPVELINESQYGKNYPKLLPAASYKLTHQCKNGRGVYSFCMCPGGFVVNSSSEKERLCVNGMSNHDRGGKNSNSALIVTVTPEDFPSTHPLAGLEFQRELEGLAYKTGNGKIPVQLFGDFRENIVSKGFGRITPNMKGDYALSNLREFLPSYMAESIIEGMEAFGHKIKGYDRADVILSGVEARTSSPVRIERFEDGQSNIVGLYPCGEGAGYAGGITSAAMDGIKMAEMVAEKLSKR